MDEPSRTVEAYPTAQAILRNAIDVMEARAAVRDQAQERSMARCVNLFYAATDLKLTEGQGWLFMELLKVARSVQGGYNPDDYVDGAAYAALRGECEAIKGK